MVELVDSIDLVDDLLLFWLELGLNRCVAWSIFDFDLTMVFGLLKLDGELERTRRDLIDGAAKYGSFLPAPFDCVPAGGSDKSPPVER